MSLVSATRRSAVATSALLLGVTLAGCGAISPKGDYPQRDIQVVVPYPAGSGIDTTTRALAEIIDDQGTFDHRLQIVNKEGGSGSVGTTEVLNAKADGYTIGVVPDGPLTLVPQTEEVAYDADDATLLNEIISSPIMFVVPEDSPYRSLDDLIDAAKKDPDSVTLAEGPLNYAVPADKVEEDTGASFKRIDYDGDQATTTALLGGNVDAGVMQLASALPQLKSGKIRALAMTSEEPVDMVPDVPTFKSEGIDLVWDAYNVAVAPSGLPDDVAEKLEKAFADAVASPEFAKVADQLGLIVSGAGPEDTKAHLEEKVDLAKPLLEADE